MTSKGGFMDMRWHKMENCGRLLLGAYCHHFHLLGAVGGHIEGTVTTNSIGKAITVHGTSGTMVRDNVVWNHRGTMRHLRGERRGAVRLRRRGPMPWQIATVIDV